jgi:ElaB/YqjD/DUF883 family membrane-anchored ribosome-binding protein
MAGSRPETMRRQGGTGGGAGRGNRPGQSRSIGRIGDTDDFEAGGQLSSVETTGRSGSEPGFMANARELGGKSLRKAGEAGQEVGGRVADFVRDNPWPTILIGAGAAWLAVDSIRGRSDTEIDMGVGRREGGDKGPNMFRRSMTTVAGAGRGAGEQVSGFVRENPVWAGIAALGIGLAVGMTIPSTVSENKMLGDARDNVVRKARQVASSAAETVREVSKSAGRIAGASQKGNS